MFRFRLAYYEVQMRKLWLRFLFLVLGTAALAVATAQPYPQRSPIRLVVAATAGASGDFNARLISEYLTKALGQAVYVDNKPGAGGIIAATSMLNAPPDGYTLIFASTTSSHSMPIITPASLLMSCPCASDIR